MSDLAPLAAPTAARVSRPTPPEVLTSPKSMPPKTGTPVAEVQMPLYRKSSNAIEDVATARWRAVHDRDRNADGTFVFAVKTTGIYCRPSCPARRPKFQNVSFFADGAAARAAGFRPCKRCRPDELPAIERAVAEARRRIDAAEGEAVGLAELAAAVRLSPAHLQREFRRRIGLSPKQYALAHRAERLKRALASGRDVLDAGFEAGYGSASRIYDEAARNLGMTPGRFRDGGRGVRIVFAERASELGHLLLAATERGLCAVRLGDSAAAVRAELAAAGEALAAEILGKASSESIARTKRLLLALPGLELDERLGAAAEANAAARATADCRRGIATFLAEKKTPDWRSQ